MKVSKIQMFLLMQNQIMQIQTNGKMSLTRVAAHFRTVFKKAVGLPKNATHLQVLMAVGDVYQQMGIVNEFFEYLNKPHCLVDGKPLVTPEMLEKAYGKPTIAELLS